MDKSKLEEAKRRNERLQSCKEWGINGINISFEDFYDVQTTINIREDIIAKLDDVDSKKKSIICKTEDSIEMFSNYASKLVCLSTNYVFFEAKSREIGALKLPGKVIKSKLEYIISKSELLNNGCSIFICSYGLENGMCLWRGEYDSRIYLW